MYLRIENKGVAPVESFTLLGASSSRGNTDLIGQFGSGAKHGVNLCLRRGIYPHIFAGNTSLEFFTKPIMFKDEEMQQVYVNIDGESEKLSFCTDFGGMDWDNLGMALREFISNAIDSSENGASDVSIELVSEEPQPKEGHTRIYIEACNDVKKYVGNLHGHFLHFTNRHKERILNKTKKSKVRFFRMGVFVREDDSDMDSLFDYNFDHTAKIDECRNMDSYTASGRAAELLSASPHVEKVFQCLIDNKECWETNHLSEYWLDKGTKEAWQKAWKNIAGDSLIASPTHGPMINNVINKGFKVCVIDNTTWYKVMAKYKIPCILDFLSAVETKGQEIIDTPIEAEQTLSRVWSWIQLVSLTQNKKRPELKIFQKIMDGGTTLCGYWNPKEPCRIYINNDNILNEQTFMEEVAHYITNANDSSRDFQDYAFKLATELAKKLP